MAARRNWELKSAGAISRRVAAGQIFRTSGPKSPRRGSSWPQSSDTGVNMLLWPSAPLRPSSQHHTVFHLLDVIKHFPLPPSTFPPVSFKECLQFRVLSLSDPNTCRSGWVKVLVTICSIVAPLCSTGSSQNSDTYWTGTTWFCHWTSLLVSEPANIFVVTL